MNIAKYARRFPLPVRDWIRDSFAGQLYQKVQRKIANPTRVSVETPNGPISMMVYEYWSQLDTIKQGDQYEPVLMKELHQRLTSRDVFYNVGARWGIFSLYAQQLGVPLNQIHSFEADGHNYDLLEANLADQPHCTYARVGPEDAPDAIRLDSYAQENHPPTVVKIDVEGAEYAVLTGMVNILETASPDLFVEVHPEYLSDRGDSQEELVDLLTDKEYDLHVCLNNRNSEYHWERIDQARLPTCGDYLLRADS